MREAPINPDRQIVDPHLHLWDIPAGFGAEPQRFLLDEALAMIADSGHRLTHSVYVECNAMYRPSGPEELRSLGETEFANGMAAMSASGRYGPVRLCGRIVAKADLMLGDAVAEVLDAHMAAAGGRLAGIRYPVVYSERGLFGHPCDPALDGVLRAPAVREGAARLAERGLTLDLWCLADQLPDVLVLADAVPGLVVVLDHLSLPDMRGANADGVIELRRQWAGSLAEAARRENTRIKLGGLGMDIGSAIPAAEGAGQSQVLAEAWKPWIETAIAAFGPDRAMFESNFPPDRGTCSYGVLWNTFKRIAAQYSPTEADSLFSRTAASTYGVAI